MEIRRVGDAILRSHPSPLLSFLVPSIPPSSWINRSFLTSYRSQLAHSMTNQKSYATRSSALQAPFTATAEKVEEPNEQSNEPPRPAEQQRSNYSDLLDSMPLARKSVKNSKTRGYNSRYTQIPFENSAQVLVKALQEDAASPIPMRRHQGAIARDLGMSSREADTARDISRESRHVAMMSSQKPTPPPVRLDAYIGRGENVTKANDLGRALRRLDTTLAINQVRHEFSKQRFHERPGLRRKRLKSSRWRKRFKEGFQAVVAKVQNMRKQGW